MRIGEPSSGAVASIVVTFFVVVRIEEPYSDRVVIGLSLAVGLDGLFGDPRSSIHPVAWFGGAMNSLERKLFRDSRCLGAAYFVVGVCLAWIATYILKFALFTLASVIGLNRKLGSRLAERVIGIALTALAGYLSLSGNSLRKIARSIEDKLAGSNGDMLAGSNEDKLAGPNHDMLAGNDLEGARAQLRSLVGRNSAELSVSEVARATIESLAENSVDATVAPLFWGALYGAPGFMIYRAINTMDAMVGYSNIRYRKFGWASARADDVANWLPARISYLIVKSLAGDSEVRERISKIARTQSRDHPSPNGGLIEGAFAGALGITLGGTTIYPHGVEERPILGFGPAGQVRDIALAIKLSRQLQQRALVLCMSIGIFARLFVYIYKYCGQASSRIGQSNL